MTARASNSGWHTERVFRLRPLSAAQIVQRVEAARRWPAPRDAFLSIDGLGPDRSGRRRYAHDRLTSCLGTGNGVFVRAKRALERWAEFDLGWARVANPEARIAVGEIVAVEVRSLGLWSLNLSRIVEVVDTPQRFGFVYSTTEMHVEQGTERFLLRFDAEAGKVWYELEALSRPRSRLAKLGYPVTRAFQRRFARDSHRRMSQAAQE